MKILEIKDPALYQCKKLPTAILYDGVTEIIKKLIEMHDIIRDPFD